MPRLRARIIGIAIVSACGFTASNMQGGDSGTSPIDSSVDAYIPDASACLRGSAECIANGQMLRVCDGAGLQPHDEPCSWSCLSTPEPHCAKLVPTGGAVTTADLDGTTLGDTTINGAPTATLDTDTGAISGGVRPAGIGSILNGIEVTQRGNVTVFRFNKLTINGVTLRITGTRAAALVSITDMTINAEIDVQGDCAGRTAGPGGFAGGPNETAGGGSGGGDRGTGGNADCTGGGGGGFGGNGGNGGRATNAGAAFGTPVIASLVGGGGGGGGGGVDGGEGGGGGGALQLVANQRITINGAAPLAGGINAGGCGGQTGAACGGGGGAGGAILIEAPVIDFRSTTLAVNGGGGGGGSAGSAGRDASLNTTSAAGGNGGGGPGAGNSGGDGGDGGDDEMLDGEPGESSSRAGGGGGGVGRMRFNTLSGNIVRSGTTVFSPALTSSQQTTTVSTGLAVIR